MRQNPKFIQAVMAREIQVSKRTMPPLIEDGLELLGLLLVQTLFTNSATGGNWASKVEQIANVACNLPVLIFFSPIAKTYSTRLLKFCFTHQGIPVLYKNKTYMNSCSSTDF